MKIPNSIIALASVVLLGGQAREGREDVDETVESGWEEVEEAGEDVVEEGKEAAEAITDQDEPTPQATSGIISGTLGSTLGTKIVIRDERGRELTLGTDDETRVVYRGQEVDIDKFEEGTQVRASWELEDEDRLAREVTILSPKL